MATQRFGYEYQAVREVPVSSEVSDRAQYAMFSALDEYKPIYLRGDVYSGKTTAVVQVFNHNT